MFMFILIFRLLTAPVCAAVEVYLVNKELWNSQIPRINALLVSFVSITLFPLWYFFFLAALLASIYDTEGSKISRRDKRIIYDHQKDPKFPLQKSLMAMVFLIFSPAWFLAFCDQAIGTVIYTAIRNRKKELIKKGKKKDTLSVLFCYLSCISLLYRHTLCTFPLLFPCFFWIIEMHREVKFFCYVMRP